MVQLLFSAEAFRPNESSVARMPMLLDEQMGLIEPACAWLMYIALVRGQTRSLETWRTYGEALYDWWQTLEANGWLWDSVSSGEIAAYRDNMLRPASPGGKALARSTINSRLRTIARFYRWCAGKGLIEKEPFGASDLSLSRSRPPGFLAHVDANGGRQRANDLTVRHVRKLPRPLAPQSIRRIMTGMNMRNRLIVEWAVATGIRRMEVAGLKLSLLPKASDEPMPAMQIVTTKGDQARTIYPPSTLLDRTWAYIREERAVAFRRSRARNGDREPGAVFLTERGTPISARRIGAMFAAAAETAEVLATFHALRHTFATVMLRFLQREAQVNPDLNPLLTLQVMLGHADLATTAIYLDVVATDLSIVETSVDNLYAALL